MSAHHIVRSFDEELKYLEKGIAQMGRHAEGMVERSIKAIIDADQNLAVETIAQDSILDKAERDIGEKAIMIIARRQPMAVDLREIIGTIRIASDLERIGDMAKNIAKRSMRISQERQMPSFYRSLESFSVLALQQLNEVLEAYSSRSLERISEVRAQDGKIDSMYTSIFRELLTYMMEDPSKITSCTHLLFCAKNIERMGDHVTNIAETLYYIVTGGYMPGERPKTDFSYTANLDEASLDEVSIIEDLEETAEEKVLAKNKSSEKSKNKDRTKN